MPPERCSPETALPPDERCSWENAFPAEATEASGAASAASIVFTCLTYCATAGR